MTAPSLVPRTISRRKRRGSIASAAFTTLNLRSLWPVALLGFLVRGGLVLLLLPGLALPTTSGITILVAPALTPLVFGEPSPALVAVAVTLGAVVIVALVAGSALGAWADLGGLRLAQREHEHSPTVLDRSHLLLRAVAVRLVAHLPLAIALAWGAVRVVDATYRELVLPDDIATPLGLRVLRDVPDAIAIVALAWLAGETIGGLALRRLATADASLLGALGWAMARFVVRPLGSLVALAASSLVVGLAVMIALVGSGIAWDQTSLLLGSDAPPVEAVLAVVAFVAVWLAGLVLVAVATAFRSVTWTFELLSARDPGAETEPVGGRGHRTIGGGGGARPGEWSGSEVSGRL
jgi:hypothetical protein